MREFDADGLLLAKYQGKIFIESLERENCCKDCPAAVFSSAFFHYRVAVIHENRVIPSILLRFESMVSCAAFAVQAEAIMPIT